MYDKLSHLSEVSKMVEKNFTESTIFRNETPGLLSQDQILQRILNSQIQQDSLFNSFGFDDSRFFIDPFCYTRQTQLSDPEISNGDQTMDEEKPVYQKQDKFDFLQREEGIPFNEKKDARKQASLHEEGSQLNLSSNGRVTKCLKNRSEMLKNFLSTVKRAIIKLIGHKLFEIENEVVQIFLQNKNNTNRQQFQNMFQNDEAYVLLCPLFYQRTLHRQLQLSVLKSENRKLFLSELNLIKKAFTLRRLPNL